MPTSAQIWTDDQISQWSNDAIGQIAVDVNCIWAREALNITAGISVYTLPNYVRTLRRVTWRGRTLDAVNWEELTYLSPATVFAGQRYIGVPNGNIETSQRRPLYYAMHPTNPYDIRLYPTPSESFIPSQIPNVYAPQVNEPGCCIDYYREPDTNSSPNPIVSLPPYIQRRTVKAYVLWRAFNAEGKGQDTQAAAYYKAKYQFLISQFTAINEGCFVGKRYSVDDGMLTIDGFRYPKPILPSNFERVIF